MDPHAVNLESTDKLKKRKKSSTSKKIKSLGEDASPNNETQEIDDIPATPPEVPQERRSSALEAIEEILNPSIKIPETIGEYVVPAAVLEGDVDALNDLDERKLIELKEVFTMFDTDADGVISEADLRATFMAVGKETSHEQIRHMMEEALQPLTFDSFVMLMGYKTIELDPEDVLLEAWSKWDKHGTGTIEEEACVDQLNIFPHLREPIIQDTNHPDDTICHENIYQFLPIHQATQFNAALHQNHSIDTNQIMTSTGIIDKHKNLSLVMSPASSLLSSTSMNRKNFRIQYRQSIFSSERILGIRLIYDHLTNEPFTIIGKFQFIDKVLFKNDGNLVPTTFCDYQFLPRPINYAKELNQSGSVWRYFHSPRYPAKYPDHIKCTYKFIGRPRNRVEVIFEEIYLLTGHSSCIRQTDKIIIYDGKSTDKASVLDVLCNEMSSQKVISSGPNFLIEFETSSNRTSNGFSAKYRFVDMNINQEKLSIMELDLPEINTLNKFNISENTITTTTTIKPLNISEVNQTTNQKINKTNNTFMNLTKTEIILPKLNFDMNNKITDNISSNYSEMVNNFAENLNISQDTNNNNIRICPPGIYNLKR